MNVFILLGHARGCRPARALLGADSAGAAGNDRRYLHRVLHRQVLQSGGLPVSQGRPGLEPQKPVGELSCVKTSPPQSCHANLHADNVSHAEPHEKHFPFVFWNLSCSNQHDILDLWCCWAISNSTATWVQICHAEQPKLVDLSSRVPILTMVWGRFYIGYPHAERDSRVRNLAEPERSQVLLWPAQKLQSLTLQ